MSSLVRGMLSMMRGVRPGFLVQHAVLSSATPIRVQCPQRTFTVSSFRRNDSDLFNYTSGRWLINEGLRLAERKHVFNVDGLCQLAAEAVNRSPNDIVDFRKFEESEEYHRSFLITMADGFKLVARIPYLYVEPTYLTVSSEVATMYFMRELGLPVPQVYLYSVSKTDFAIQWVVRHYDGLRHWLPLVAIN